MRRMTIDELARRSSTTTRTIRSYQDRGLLPPPQILGRTGYYDEGHLARLALISRLLNQRFSLASIGTLLAAWEEGKGLGDLLGFEEELVTPYDDSTPEHLTGEQLSKRFGPSNPDAMEAAIELGLLAEADDGFIALSPGLIDAGQALVEAGVPVEALLEEAHQLQDDCDRIAQRFSRLFIDFVWKPYLARGAPPQDLPRIGSILASLRPLPAQTTSAMVAQAMQRRFEEATAALLGADELLLAKSDIDLDLEFEADDDSEFSTG